MIYSKHSMIASCHVAVNKSKAKLQSYLSIYSIAAHISFIKNLHAA